MLFRAKSGLSYKFYLLIKIYVTTFRKQFAPDLIFKSKIEGEGERGKKILLMRTALLAKIDKIMELQIPIPRKCAGLP